MSNRFSIAGRSYTSLGQGINSNSCANPGAFDTQSMRYQSALFLALNFLEIL